MPEFWSANAAMPNLPAPCCEEGTIGPVLLDRTERIRARLSRAAYPAVPGLVADAIVALAQAQRGDGGRPAPGMAAELRDILLAMLRDRPAGDLMLLQFLFVEELPASAIALLTGTSVAETRRARSRALARLAAGLGG